MEKKKAITCLKPSDGGLHFGHYIGNIEPLIKYQDDFECYFIFSDLQMINLGNKFDVLENIYDMMKQMIALGVDPNKVIFGRESIVKEKRLNDLIAISNYLSNTRIDRLPLFKSIEKPYKMSMYLYPLLQALDFYMTDAEIAFSNTDNKPAIELINELFAKMNHLEGRSLKHIELIHGVVDFLVGVDGEKMSKAKGNAIFLSDSCNEISKKVNKMYTDPLKIHADSPGHVEGNVVFQFFKAFLSNEEYWRLCDDYEKGKLPDRKAKAELVQILNDIAKKSKTCNYSITTLNEILIRGEKRMLYHI